MPRIACLLVPDLPVAALCRADPNLHGRRLALVDGHGPHALVIAASAAARRHGIHPGRHSAAQARAIAADLVVRPRDPAAEHSAARALAEVAGSLASRLEVTADGTVFLDAAGSLSLAGSEAGLTSALVARAARVGLAARAGLAASKITALLAARHGDGTEVVPAGTERGFLAPLPLACLAPEAEIAATLARWGVRTLGNLARLPAAEVATRLGAAGVRLIRAARGEDEHPLAPQALAHEVEESLALEHPLDNLEPLLFVLRGLVERALDRLGLHGIGCTRAHLALTLDDRSRDERALDLAAPTRDVKTILTCLRVALETRLPRAAITHLVLTAVPERVRATQLGLFTPAGPAPERLATTLAWLDALCGAGRVGAPAVVDSHRPGGAATVPFTPAAAAEPAAAEPPAGCRLVVRTLRPPRPIEVFAERSQPCFVRGQGLGGRVVGAAGPWRTTGEWWSEARFARDYYDLELSDGGIYRCYCEPSGRWFVDGVYD